MRRQRGQGGARRTAAGCGAAYGGAQGRAAAEGAAVRVASEAMSLRGELVVAVHKNVCMLMHVLGSHFWAARASRVCFITAAGVGQCKGSPIKAGQNDKRGGKRSRAANRFAGPVFLR